MSDNLDGFALPKLQTFGPTRMFQSLLRLIQTHFWAKYRFRRKRGATRKKIIFAEKRQI